MKPQESRICKKSHLFSRFTTFLEPVFFFAHPSFDLTGICFIPFFLLLNQFSATTSAENGHYDFSHHYNHIELSRIEDESCLSCQSSRRDEGRVSKQTNVDALPNGTSQLTIIAPLLCWSVVDTFNSENGGFLNQV